MVINYIDCSVVDIRVCLGSCDTQCDTTTSDMIRYITINAMERAWELTLSAMDPTGTKVLSYTRLTRKRRKRKQQIK